MHKLKSLMVSMRNYYMPILCPPLSRLKLRQLHKYTYLTTGLLQKQGFILPWQSCRPFGHHPLSHSQLVNAKCWAMKKIALKGRKRCSCRPVYRLHGSPRGVGPHHSVQGYRWKMNIVPTMKSQCSRYHISLAPF